MSTSQRIAPTVTLWFLALAVAGSGCTTATSQHPLSDDKSSTIDKRLIGHWRLLEKEDIPGRPRFVVGRVKDTANTLEFVFAELGHGNTVKIVRFPLFPTSIGGKAYVSIRGPRRDRAEYLIFQYKVVDNDRGGDDDELHLFPMTTKTIVRAIEGDHLAGTVLRHKKPLTRTADNPFKSKYRSIGITAKSEQLIAYIRKDEKNIFDTTRPIVLKRCQPIWR